MSHPRKSTPTDPRNSPPRERCLVDGCDRLEEMAGGRPAGGLCAGHRYRKKRGLPLEAPLHAGLARRQTPREALVAAALELGDVPAESSGDAVFRRVVERLTYAAVMYAAEQSRKGRP